MPNEEEDDGGWTYRVSKIRSDGPRRFIEETEFDNFMDAAAYAQQVMLAGFGASIHGRPNSESGDF